MDGRRRRLGSSLPGVCFSDFALLHFHQLAVPAVARDGNPEGTFWIRPAPGLNSLSRFQVANALNFCFSRPGIRFHVLCLAPNLFSARAGNRNMAAYIVSRRRCVVGRLSLLLFPSLASAMAVGAARTEQARDDVTNQIQNPGGAWVAGVASATSGLPSRSPQLEPTKEAEALPGIHSTATP